MMPRIARPGWAALAGLLLCPVLCSGQAAPVWQIDGDSNRIYLLGSIHILRQHDHPLPTAIAEAYDDADILIMEVDMDDVDPVEMAGLVSDMGLIKESGSLEQFMGPELYRQAIEYAAELDVPLDLLAKTEPWLAAITIEQMILVRIGFSPKYGIEFYLSDMAGRDNKEIRGFETVRDQLEFLDRLSLGAQRELLIQTLKESLTIDRDIDQLIGAWRMGDVVFLEEYLLAELQQYRELYNTLVVNRNAAWVERIRRLTGEADDFLVVVGILHLIGEDGVPALLKKAGIAARQLGEHDP